MAESSYRLDDQRVRGPGSASETQQEGKMADARCPTWLFLVWTLMLALVATACRRVAAMEAVPRAADITMMVNADSPKEVRLEANLAIPDGGELVLSVEVPHESINVRSMGPAKVARVFSDHEDGTFGVGETINVFVQFTSAVQVTGSDTPWLLLRTGCHESTCHVREIQRLRCRATKGKFAVTFGDQFASNIPWNASTKVLAGYLRQMTQIDDVIVEYHIDEDRACTFFGNNITITFESMNIFGDDGDLPELTADANNLVGDGVVLEHVHVIYEPTLTPNAWELQKGVRRPDRRAEFVGQADPQTLQFTYTVQIGDNTSRLEYANSDSLAISLRTGDAHIANADDAQVKVNPTLPPPGFAGDWERGIGSSLSANNAIEVNVAPPFITGVTSPHADGTFGIGEEILVHVYFSQPIVVSGLPTIVLETGAVDRILPFVQVVQPEGIIAEFRYIIQSKDTSPDLTYVGRDSFQLNGGWVKRRATTPTTDANLTLPANGESGSMSVNKNIVVDTSDPQIMSVSTTDEDGTYTAGDVIPIVVTFDVPVVVSGTPTLMMSTGTVDLFPGEFVQEAPTLASANTIVFPSVNHGLATAASAGLQFEIDGQILTVASVNGDRVTMAEAYTSTVVDPTNIGGPTISINTPGYRPASYASGSGTTALVFEYTVQVGDISADLDYTSTTALKVGTGSIKRLSTTPFTDADLTLVNPGVMGSLSFDATIVINTDAPLVTGVNAISRDGVYKAKDDIVFEVVFDLPVVVSLTASVLTNVATAGTERYAVYSEGSGTTSLKFVFPIIELDEAAVFDYRDTLSLRATYGSVSGWIRRKSASPMLPAVLELPALGLSSKGISIQQTCEVILNVTASHEDGTYGVGEVISFQVQYSAAVDVDTSAGVPAIDMTTGNQALYTSGTGTDTLTFRYVIQAPDIAGRLVYRDYLSLKLNGGTVKATADASLASTILPLPELSSLGLVSAIFVQTSPTTVQAVTTRTQDGILTVGDTIVVAVEFGYPVEVTPLSAGAGTPALLLHVGVSTGVWSVFVSSEDEKVYFSYKVGERESTIKLAYSSRVALKCVGGSGLNQNAVQNAQSPRAAVLESRLFISWVEMSSDTGAKQIRVKSFDLLEFPPLHSFEDGGAESSIVNFDASLDASTPCLTVFAGRLYLVWQEVSADTNNPTQIRAAVLKATASTGASAQWAFVDKQPAVSPGINKLATENAVAPHAISHNSKLYVAWNENAAGIAQTRVAVYNGVDGTPSWTFVDGNQNTRGLNYDASKSAKNVQLCSCASSSSSTRLLYAVWEELATGTNIPQVRVAVQTGTDASPLWKFVDGNDATGINFDVLMTAALPSIVCLGGSSIVVAWHETTAAAGSAVLLKKFNGNLVSPSWTKIDGGSGLNYDKSQNAQNVRLSVQVQGGAESLYAIWDEVERVSTVTQIRMAHLTTINGASVWKFLDGGERRSTINDDATHAASQPTLAVGQFADETFAIWQEAHSNGNTHVRASVLGPVVWEWQSICAACILRKSTLSETPANLLLPDVNGPGALDFAHSIRIETSAPEVEDVSMAGEVASSISSATTVQTIDVFNTGSITQGEYKLIYGHLLETPCIAWNAPASGVGSVEAALESIPTLALDVSVVEDTSAFHDGRRYTVTFVYPTTGLQPLQVKMEADGACRKFVCLADALLPCSSNLVQINQNADVRSRSGVIDVAVRFSFPVSVQTGTPQLTLESGATDHNALYTTRSALQEFDVGVESASPVLRGSFKLSYGDFSSGAGMGTISTTECIGLPPNDDDGAQEMKAKLEGIAAINTIGIHSVSRHKLGHGYRFVVEFRNSGNMLDLVAADSSVCSAVAGRTQTIDISADSAILTGEIKVNLGEATSACIPWDLRAKGATASMEASLSGITSDRTIPLQVVKDPTAYPFGARYYVSFLMLDDAMQPLIVSSDPGCAAFTCDNGSGGATTCNNLVVAANYDFRVSRAASKTISFQYIVQPSDNINSLTVKDATSLTGSIIRSSMNPTVAASLTLPKPSDALLSSPERRSVSIVSLTTIPAILRVYSTTLDDTYTAGDIILVFVAFSENVEVEGVPILELDSNGEAFYVSGGGTNELEFYYQVGRGEASSDLNYASVAALRTFTSPESRIRCAACFGSSVDADITLPALASVSSLAANNDLVIDTATPSIVQVTSSRPDIATGEAGYGVGDIVDVVVEFSTDVAVSGIPSLALSTGGTAFFTYEGYRQLIDVGVDAVVPVTSGQFSITYNGERSGCIDFDDADSSDTTSLKSRLLEFDAIARIGVLSVTLTRKKNGNRFVILFDSTQVVDVPSAIGLAQSDVCAPLLPMATAPEFMVSRSTDQYVVFHYLIGEGETTGKLNFMGTTVIVPAGEASIMRRAGSPTIDASIALPSTLSPQSLANTKVLKIDGSPVVILDVVSDSGAGTYGVGFPSTASPPSVAPGEILFHLVFSRGVSVIGSPTVELATGSLRPSGEFIPNRFATFAGQPQADHVAFLYHIQEEDFSANLEFASLNVLDGAAIYVVSSSMVSLARTLLPRLTISASSVLEVDAYSVPTTVKLASTHDDGVYGAGEQIEILVTFSKEVILMTGLNRDQDWHARYPVALEFQDRIYVMWTERDDMHAPTQSFLYMRVFSSDTLDVVETASTSAMNRVPATFIEKVSMTVWIDRIYAAWDEGGLIYCAVFEGLEAALPWTLIPNMGANKDKAMAASDPVLIVYNLELVLVWRELSLPSGGSALVGQIRVAVRNEDLDAPLWIFHDGNQPSSGINKNPLMDADDPTAEVYRGRLYLTWTEMNDNGAYEIVIARRNIQTRDFSTWTYLQALPSTYPEYDFLSSYRPQLVVRRKGVEDMALLISWYRDTVTSNVSEIITGQVLDLDWEASITGSIPQTISAAESNTSVSDTLKPNTKGQQFVTCGDTLYSSWLELAGVGDATTEDGAHALKLATLPTGSDVYTGWTQAANQSILNHNPEFDVVDSFLICSSQTSTQPVAGVVWTEYDGNAMKLRFRHHNIVPRTPGMLAPTYGEVTAGAPILMLATQSTPEGFAACIDKSGLISYTLTFVYVVQPGESSPDLEILGSDAFKLNGAAVRDHLGQPPDFTLFPASTDLRSLGYNNELTINTVPPTVASVTSTLPSGEYGVGEYFVIQVVFTDPVIVIEGEVSSVPTLMLRSDELHPLTSMQGSATYFGGSGSKVLLFEYTSSQQDYCEKLEYLDSTSLLLNGEGWAIKRNATRPTTDAVLTLPPPKSQNSLSGTRAIAIKPTSPSVISVTSSVADGIYYPGDTIVIDVVFSLRVVVFGSPVLLLDTGAEPSRAFLAGGNETTTLSFRHDIIEGESSAHLDVVDDRSGNEQVHFVMSLELAGYSEIKRASANPYTPATIALPAPGLAGSLSANKNFAIDSTPPAVVDIRSSVADGTYDVGEEIDILVEFSHKVAVIGTPQLMLNVPGRSQRTAMYIDGSESNVLRFLYIPEEGDNSLNVALDIKDEKAFILRPLLGGREMLQTPAQVLCLSAKPVLDANLTMPVPGVAVRADAVLSLVGNNRKIFVRTDGFRVQSLAADVPDDIYSPGQRIVISVAFTGTTVVQGSPRIKLNSNELTASYAKYIGGTSTPQLQFEYIVATGDSCLTLDAATTSALELNGGVISDAEGIYSPLRLGLPSLPRSLSYSCNIGISSEPPTVERIYSTNIDGEYGVGDHVLIAVHFSRKVAIETPSVAPIPTLSLQFDTGTRSATYDSGDETDTLLFQVQVANGDSSNRLEYADSNALVGTIFALATTLTTLADLELPLPGETGSLSDSSAIAVISTPPTVEGVSAVDRDGTYGLFAEIRIRVRFSFPVVVSTATSPLSSCVLKLSVGDIKRRRAVYTGGSATNTLEFVYTVEAGDRSARLDYTDSSGLTCDVLQATDVPTLLALNMLAVPGAVGSLGHTSSLRIDATAPRIVSVSSQTTNGVYGAGQAIDISVVFSEAVLVPVDGTPRLRLAIASNAAVNALLDTTGELFASYVEGSGTSVLTLTYIVREGDMALPLDYAGIDAFSMNPPETQLAAAVSGQSDYRFATLRLPVPGATGSLSNNRDIHIDTLKPPRVLSVGTLMPNGIYTAGDTLTLSLKFTTPVVVGGAAPTLLLDTGNPESSSVDKQAVYVAGSGTSELLFEYVIQEGDRTGRLEYRRCPSSERRTPERREWDKYVICSKSANALQLGEPDGTIKRMSTFPVTDAVLDLPEVSAWSKVRYETAYNEITYVNQVEPATDIPAAERTVVPELVNEFSVTHQLRSINIYSNGVPDHATALLERVEEQRYFIELQRFPEQQSNPLELSMTPDAFAGIFLNGILFKVGGESSMLEDTCGGAVDADSRYFYVGLPVCYLEKIHEPREAAPSEPFVQSQPRPPSIIVAYALDGFPVYGFYDEDGNLPSDLDECHGRVRRDGQYAYHLVPPTPSSASPFMACLKGIDAVSTPSQLTAFRYPADVAAVEGLSLSMLSRFDGLVIDGNPETSHAAAWLNPEGVSVVYTSTSVIVRSTGVPAAGSAYGPFPNAYNRFSVFEQDYVFRFPRHPEISASSTALPLDTPIGVMLNGVPFFASDSSIYGGNVFDSANSAYVLLDKCNGLVDAGGDYRYYASPDCLLDELSGGAGAGEPSPLIGFAFDGFPLYGPYDEDGELPGDLDTCNGRVGDDGTYRYHVTQGAPFLLGCFRGDPATVVNPIDMAGNLYRSLSYAHALGVNTDTPRVAHIFTNKRPGAYVTGESIDIVVEWSAPVAVDTTNGLPSLAIQNSSRTAVYDISSSSATRSRFIFMVTSDDANLAELSYDARIPIQLNGASITRLAATPVLAADLALLPFAFDDPNLVRTGSAGLASKFQLVRDLRVELRGLYHPRATDLRGQLFHGRRQSTIFDTGCCSPRDTFGVPDVPDVLINRAQIGSELRNPTSGVGWDYSFSDFDSSQNLALAGGAMALQSSTSGTCTAYNAIDGKIRGASVAKQSVARTHPSSSEEESAWWELRLLENQEIGTVRVWLPEKEPELPALVLVLRVDSSDGASAVTGNFTLIFTVPDGQRKISTDPISFNAVAMIVDENPRIETHGIGLGESVQAKLAALGDLIPQTFVTRDPRDALDSAHGAFTWHITFLDNPRAASGTQGVVAPVLTVGENSICDGTGVVELTIPPPVDDNSDPFVYHAYDSTGAVKHADNTSRTDGGEQPMFPFWILLFEHSAVLDVESFEDAHNRAVFAHRVDGRHANRSSISVNPPPGTTAQYVRLVTERPRSSLNLAEVEVFARQNHVLSQYPGGTPVRPVFHPGGESWSPEEPFRYSFGGMSAEGVWMLAIADTAVNGTKSMRAKMSAGGISDWALHVTNEAGETRAYFMDFQVQLHALPRHGTLYVALDQTERDHLDVDANGLLDSSEADVYLRRFSPNNYDQLPVLTRERELYEFMLGFEAFGGVEVLQDASERQKRVPSRVCDPTCLAKLGMDPYFYVGLAGDTALKLLRVVGDHVVKYVPQPGFRGTDAFTYSVSVSGQEGPVLGTVQLTVKRCEDPECRMASVFLHRGAR